MAPSFGQNSYASTAEESTFGVPPGTNEQQTLTPSAPPTSGQYKLDFSNIVAGAVTAFISYNAVASQVQAAIALVIDEISVVVTGGPLTSGAFTLEYTNALGQRGVAQVTVTNSTLSDGSPVTLTPATTVPGVGPTRDFLEILEESMENKQSRISKPTLFFRGQNRNVKSKVSIEGQLKLQAQFHGMMQLLKQAFGSEDTTGLDGYSGSHLYTLTNQPPAGLSVVVDRGSETLGKQFQYSGCQVDKLTLTQGVEDFLMLQADLVGRSELPIYPLPEPDRLAFQGVDWEMETSISIDGTEYPGKMTEFVMDKGLSKDRYKLGSRLRKGIGTGNVQKITGKIELELDGMVLYNLFRNLTQFSISAVWTGPKITSSNNFYSLTINLTKCALSGKTPNVKNHDVIIMELPFEAYFDEDAGTTEIEAVLVNDIGGIGP